MENTVNNTVSAGTSVAGKCKDRLYVVSFGHSDKYLLCDTADGAKKRLAELDASLNAYLKAKFPSETFAYFTTPRVTEVECDHREKYKGYAELNDAAVAQIKECLDKEVEDMNSVERLNQDAPYSDINPAAAGVGGLL